MTMSNGSDPMSDAEELYKRLIELVKLINSHKEAKLAVKKY